MQRIGLGAAWPRPQMEASPITVRQVVQRVGIPHLGLHQLRGLGGAHAAGRALAAALVGRKNASRSAPRRGRGLWLSTMTAAEPMKQPCGCRVSKSSGTSASAGGQDAAAGAAGQVGVQLVAVGHAAAVLVDQFAQRDAGRRQLHAGLASPAR
jgi:hypothetical protein